MKRRTKNVLCGLAMVASFGLGYAISPGKDKVIETIKEVQGIEHGVETCERGFELTNEYLNTCDLDADAAVALSGKALNGISGDYLKDSIKLQESLNLTSIDELLPYANAVKEVAQDNFNTQYADKVTPERFMNAGEVKCLDNVAGDSRFFSFEYNGKEVMPLHYDLLGEEQITFVDKDRMSPGIQNKLNNKLSEELEKAVAVEPDNYVMIGPPGPN
mgnify:CR=1 FL=1|jgi:hypothetical protein